MTPDGWLPVTSGESGDRVWRRPDGGAFAKQAGPGRAELLAGERDRLVWLERAGFTAAPRVVDWDGGTLVMTGLPGVPASALGGDDLMAAWPSIADTIAALHALPVADCPFERGLAVMAARARAVVARDAVNPDFLPDEDRDLGAAPLLARVTAELPARLAQEAASRVVVHGDACLPNIMVDPATLRCTGLIDLGRLGVADRYADLALLVANSAESWSSPGQAAQAVDLLFSGLGVASIDGGRLQFYLRLDPLTWG